MFPVSILLCCLFLTSDCDNYDRCLKAESTSSDFITSLDITSLLGHWNDIKINKDTVLLKTTPQNITGRKVFSTNFPEELNFKALKVKGLVNDADIGELIDNQVSKNDDILIRSSMNFHGDISAHNVNFEKRYQGINVSELLNNITTLGTMSDFKNNYMNLLEMATLVENSMKEQAYYLNYFKLLHFVPKAHEIFSSRCVNDENRVMTFNFENGSTIMNFYRWDENQEMFISTEDFSVNLGLYPDYIKQIEWVGKDYVYIEHVAEKSEEVTEHMPDHTHVGELIHFHDDDKFQHSKFLTKGTIFVTSFEIESLNNHCLLFIDFNLDMNILCMDADEEFFVRQRNELEKPVMASVLIISYSPYMVTMRKEEARIAIWKMNDKMEFEIHQTFVEGDPIGVSTISCIHGEFIAVAYGHIPNTMEFGKVIIRRFVRENNDFAIWQTLKLKTPVQIEFALLPSQELVLYVTTENPTEPFNVYIYQGISGFSKKVGDSTLSNILDMNQFTLKNGHFVVLKHYYEIGIIKAVFKGN